MVLTKNLYEDAMNVWNEEFDLALKEDNSDSFDEKRKDSSEKGKIKEEMNDLVMSEGGCLNEKGKESSEKENLKEEMNNLMTSEDDCLNEKGKENSERNNLKEEMKDLLMKEDDCLKGKEYVERNNSRSDVNNMDEYVIIENNDQNKSDYESGSSIFLTGIRSRSQLLACGISKKAIEIDEQYQIVEKAKKSSAAVGSFTISTGQKAQKIYEDADVPNKIKKASCVASEQVRNSGMKAQKMYEEVDVPNKIKKASEQIRNFDEKYGVADKVVGAAAAIGSIQLAKGNFRRGFGTLAGAAVFASIAERSRRKNADEKHELHLS